MTIEQIKAAVEQGRTVHWKTRSYRVIKDRKGQWWVKCDNGHLSYLTGINGITMNEKPEDFFEQI